MKSENCKSCKKALQKDWFFCPNCGTAQHETSVMQEYLRSVDNTDDIPARQKNTAESKYGAGVRSQVFEVIVRQAIAGAPWQEICLGPMQVNNITIEEVEEELRKRGGGGSAPASSRQPKKPSGPDGGATMTLSSPSQQATNIRQVIEKLASGRESDTGKMKKKLKEVALELESLEDKLKRLELVVIADQAEV